MDNVIKNRMVKTSVSLEKYIPLKVFIDRKDEPVKYLAYSKDKTSLLEITVSTASGLIKKLHYC